jgi:hypothetical protein
MVAYITNFLGKATEIKSKQLKIIIKMFPYAGKDSLSDS